MGYLSNPQYREPLMMEGGDDAKQKHFGIEDHDKCCICIPLETGMNIVTVLSWFSMIGCIIVALTVGAVEGVASGEISTASYANVNCDHPTAAYKSYCKALSKAKDANNGFLGFTILCFVAAACSLIGVGMMSYWMCCGKGSGKGAKFLFWGMIIQAFSIAPWIVAFFVEPEVSWGGVIGTAVDLLFYCYLVHCAKRIWDDHPDHPKNAGGAQAAPMEAVNE